MTTPTSTRFYRYVVESLDIIFPSDGIHYTLDGKLVVGLTIERNYDTEMFPIIKLDVSLNTELYHKVILNNTSVKFRLRVQKYVYDEHSTLTMKKDVFNDVFVTFMDDNTPFLDKALFDEAAKINSADSSRGLTPITVGGNQMSFYLFKEDDLIRSKNIINTVVTQATVTDVLAYILASAGFNKTLMTPLDNTNIYTEMVVPPLTLQGNLQHYESQYGFYYKGAIIFFDIPCLYILSKSTKCTAWRKGEYTKVIFNIRDSKNPHQYTTGSFFDEEGSTTFINVRPTDIKMNSASIIQDQIDGNHRIIINPSNGYSIDFKTNAIQRGAGTYKVMIDKFNNPFAVYAEQSEIESNKQIIQVALEDIDFEAIAPNKEYSYKFEDGSINKLYSGNYRLVKSTVFINNEGDHFKAKAHCLFKK